MPWWLWLVGWLVLSTTAALWIGAAASIARRREHARRAVDEAMGPAQSPAWWMIVG